MPRSNQRVMEIALRRVIQDEKESTRNKLVAIELLAQVNGVDMRRKQRIRKKQAEKVLGMPVVNERAEELKRLI